MKALFLAIAIAIFPTLLNAHSQTPLQIRLFSAEDNVTVGIQVANINNYVQSYDVLIDGKVLGNITLKEREKREIRVSIKVDKKNAWNHKVVSTRSVLKEGQTTRSEIQTLVSVYGLVLQSSE